MIAYDEDWRREQLSTVGGSSAAAVMGKSRFKSPAKYWDDMRTVLVEGRMPPPLRETDDLRRGRVLDEAADRGDQRLDLPDGIIVPVDPTERAEHLGQDLAKAKAARADASAQAAEGDGIAPHGTPEPVVAKSATTGDVTQSEPPAEDEAAGKGIEPWPESGKPTVVEGSAVESPDILPHVEPATTLVDSVISSPATPPGPPGDADTAPSVDSTAGLAPEDGAARGYGEAILPHPAGGPYEASGPTTGPPAEFAGDTPQDAPPAKNHWATIGSRRAAISLALGRYYNARPRLRVMLTKRLWGEPGDWMQGTDVQLERMWTRLLAFRGKYSPESVPDVLTELDAACEAIIAEIEKGATTQ